MIRIYSGITMVNGLQTNVNCETKIWFTHDSKLQ